jgi:carboxylesterase type B
MFPIILLLFFSFLMVHCHPNLPSYPTSSPTAKTQNGTYVGVWLPQFDQDVFYGIPFAKAPRLSLAESLTETWEGSREATQPGPSCIGFPNYLDVELSEDCLNLNIVRPAGLKLSTKLPVMVWIHGGGFTQGSINDPKTNTSYIIETSMLINKPVIVASINYRLGALGWLFSIEVQSQGVTNIGLRDQWKALEVRMIDSLNCVSRS